jgi:hypothetical protein
MRTALNASAALTLCGALLLTACGSDNGSTSCTGSGAPLNFEYSWTCTGCGNPAGLYVTSQSGSAVAGFIMICSGNGSCQDFCMAGADSDNSFTGTVSGNCLNVESNDGTWSASGAANGNNMQITVSSTASNCFGAQSQTVNVGH